MGSGLMITNEAYPSSKVKVIVPSLILADTVQVPSDSTLAVVFSDDIDARILLLVL